jgi:hypothetical protein
MIKTNLLLTLAAVAALAGCATTASAPAGMVAGKFVAFDCDGQDFQARFNPDGNTVRVRTHHGASELSATGDGVYAGDGYKLTTKGATGVTIEHAGKELGKNCKRG